MNTRVVIWFSCGVTSAVSAWLITKDLKENCDLHVVYCDTGGEHRSNKIFLERVQNWINHPIEILKNPKYSDHFDVMEKRKYIVGVQGTACTIYLKKKLREQYQKADDIQYFGFSIEEEHRAKKLRSIFFELNLEFNLIDNNLSKSDCLAIVKKAGIDLPDMYKLGYIHNNCIGCPKGGQGYWNKIRIDFPDVFDRMAKLERKLNVAINKIRIGGKRKRLFLDELDPTAGNKKPLPSIECSPFCDAIIETEKD